MPVPLPDHDGKVFYVWFDAPIGYISATREWAAAQGDPEAWRLWWQDPGTRLVHFIGKDNIVFHAMMFPAMLMAHSEHYVLPDNVPANEFLNLEGHKLSTSRGFAVWLPDYLAKFTADPLRYTLARNLPETRDTNFTWEGFQARNNNELGNNFGNLINRVFTFIHKYFEGRVPAWSEADLTDLDRARAGRGRAGRCSAGPAHLERFEIKAALEAAFHAGQVGNRYFDESAPFRTRKTDLERCGQSLGRRRCRSCGRSGGDAGAGGAVRHGEGVGLAGHGDRPVARRLGRGPAPISGRPAAGPAGDPVPAAGHQMIQAEVERLRAMLDKAEAAIPDQSDPKAARAAFASPA